MAAMDGLTNLKIIRKFEFVVIETAVAVVFSGFLFRDAFFVLVQIDVGIDLIVIGVQGTFLGGDDLEY